MLTPKTLNLSAYFLDISNKDHHNLLNVNDDFLKNLEKKYGSNLAIINFDLDHMVKFELFKSELFLSGRDAFAYLASFWSPRSKDEMTEIFGKKYQNTIVSKFRRIDEKNKYKLYQKMNYTDISFLPDLDLPLRVKNKIYFLPNYELAFKFIVSNNMFLIPKIKAKNELKEYLIEKYSVFVNILLNPVFRYSFLYPKWIIFPKFDKEFEIVIPASFNPKDIRTQKMHLFEKENVFGSEFKINLITPHKYISSIFSSLFPLKKELFVNYYQKFHLNPPLPRIECLTELSLIRYRYTLIKDYCSKKNIDWFLKFDKKLLNDIKTFFQDVFILTELNSSKIMETNSFYELINQSMAMQHQKLDEEPSIFSSGLKEFKITF